MDWAQVLKRDQLLLSYEEIVLELVSGLEEESY